ncbi:hypothetical protein G6O69_01745 [Pseudenhygromyxa sp. WMMC2535]|uniref:hypothetical protein n=1 Tax=Pseudenhygromyxa sp. WMMC2535 TaxID=2712867 RepID=UPI0015556509|nr:hypothetical protein [Pseudenhygromyxa sp. WMMC2535]NVB36537.1 hypothetical protein [Pseudenhygromyxa sp. WMMC2535]
MSNQAVESLIQKLTTLRGKLDPEERAAFAAMVKLAAGAAERVVVEGSEPAKIVDPSIYKTQSEHSQLTPEQLQSMWKTQSEHSVFTPSQLDQLVDEQG